MKNTIILLISMFLLPLICPAQLPSNGNETAIRGDFRVLFYNVENLFDCFNDSLTLDDEFLPKGERNWTWEKYQSKSKKIGKLILAAGEWEFPDLIGLCEIENRFVLDGLFSYGYKSKLGYRIIHQESPDRRGIDVALVYQERSFQPIDTSFLQLVYKGENRSTTREILYVKGKTHTEDTLHIFVNHWPSRWGGQFDSEHKRLAAAQLLKNKVDEIVKIDRKAKILIMGDFNDYPDDKSMQMVLKANSPNLPIKNTQLYNLAMLFHNKSGIGSHKYQGKWGMLDQFIVSGTLLNKTAYLYCKPDGMSIFKPDFLLEKDRTYYGVKPFRTFVGYKYNNGFSDHLPIVLDFWRK